jgi:hypothetical protein
MCPGGGTDFNSAVTFQPSWIYGCNTGTSCNGGVNFDNRISCQPTTAMDACAPAPSCGNTSHDASNVWFKFYAMNSNVVISCFQNTSLIIGVQAFNGGPACSSLSEMGCAVSGGPSSGVSLSLSGLLPGHLYYFRIFGSATPVSQRTGLYCFCGTTGLSDIILPAINTNIVGNSVDNNIHLSWQTAATNSTVSFEVEHSEDGTTFNSIASIVAPTSFEIINHYSYTDQFPSFGKNYYRLKQIAADGRYVYSTVISIKSQIAGSFTLTRGVNRNELQVTVAKKDVLFIYSTTGQVVKVIPLSPGSNRISTSAMPEGVYLLHSKVNNITKRFYVFN